MDHQTADEESKCCNILKLQLDPVAALKNKDLKSVVKSTNVKSNFTPVSRVLKEKLKESYKPVQIALDVGLFIFFWLISSIQ